MDKFCSAEDISGFLVFELDEEGVERSKDAVEERIEAYSTELSNSYKMRFGQLPVEKETTNISLVLELMTVLEVSAQMSLVLSSSVDKSLIKQQKMLNRMSRYQRKKFDRGDYDEMVLSGPLLTEGLAELPSCVISTAGFSGEGRDITNTVIERFILRYSAVLRTVIATRGFKQSSYELTDRQKRIYKEIVASFVRVCVTIGRVRSQYTDERDSLINLLIDEAEEKMSRFESGKEDDAFL